MKGKRGQTGDQLMIFSFLFIMVLIGLGIVGGTLLFFGSEYDVRESEAHTLAYVLQSCINSQTIDWESTDVSDQLSHLCLIDTTTLSQGSLVHLKRNSVSVFSINQGKVESCGFTGARRNLAYPQCTRVTFRQGGDTFELTTGSFQKKQRVTS